MSVKFHTKFTCPTALTASNSTHRTYSKSAFSACLALSKFTCHNCHLTEPHYRAFLAFLVLCFLYDVKTNFLCGGLFRPPVGDILSATKLLVFSYEIRYKISLQKLLSKYEFRENRRSDSHSLLKWVHNFIHVISIPTDRLPWRWVHKFSIRYDIVEWVRVSWKLLRWKTYFTYKRKWKFSVFSHFPPDLNNIPHRRCSWKFVTWL